jgi:glycerol-1-phosphate dehydrogenase [NAD(P)+]
MQIAIPYTIGHDAIDKLVAYCKEKSLDRFFLIADDNTYGVLGQRVARELSAAGIDVKPIVLHDEHVTADEQTLIQVLLQTGDGEDRLFLAVGSGTLTDITRFISFRTRSHFISVPTAPSVDGYLSPGSPLIINNLKQTVYGFIPMAIFADLPTLCNAPHDMIAAGYGDMIGKLTSVADWKLGHVLWDEPFVQPLADETIQIVNATIDKTADIAQAGEDGIRTMFETLLMTGQLMVEVGNSNPASGSEHHLSHFWEMKLHLEDRPPALHGAKVAVGTWWAIKRYQTFKDIDRAELEEILDAASLPDKADEIATIRAVYGPAADQCIVKQQPFLDMTPDDFEQLKCRIAERWDVVHALADQLPTPEQVRRWLEEVNGATDIKQLGLTAEEEQQALDHAHFFRDRFTANKLFHVLGLRLDA